MTAHGPSRTGSDAVDGSACELPSADLGAPDDATVAAVGRAIESPIAPEPLIARDMARRSLWVFPAWIAACALVWGVGAAASAAFGYALVIGNLAAAAALMAWGARTSAAALMGAVLGGFIVRLGLLMSIVLAVRQVWLFAPVPFAITVIASHLGLAAWEIRYVSLRLGAAPVGVAPMSRAHRGAALVEEAS